MKNTDARAAQLITFLTAMAGDTRVKPGDRTFLTAFYTALGSGITSEKWDIDVVRIFRDFMTHTVRRQGP